jgi:cell division protease FtsH
MPEYAALVALQCVQQGRAIHCHRHRASTAVLVACRHAALRHLSNSLQSLSAHPQVTRIARLMVTQLGFADKSRLGQVAWSSGGGQSFLGQQMAQPSDFSSATADKIDNEVKQLVERAYRRAKDLLQSNVEVLHRVAAVLVEKENIDGEEFAAIIQDAKVNQYLKKDAPGVTIPYQPA